MSYQAPRILVVDDDITCRLLMQSALVKNGFAVCLSNDGEDALRQFRLQPANLVMLDVEMPGLNGYQVCAELRSEAGNELPIVMVTSMDDLLSVEKAFDAGATDFICKPIHWGLIGHRVKYLLRAYSVLQDLNSSNENLLAIFNAIPDTLVRLDTHGQVIDVRNAMQSNEQQRLPSPGCHLEEVFPADIASRIIAAAKKTHASHTPTQVDFSLDNDGGSKYFYESRLASINAEETLCLMRNVTERKENEKRVHRLAYFDTLTGLPNRLAFSERLGRDVQRARRQNSKLAVLFMDLDGFKKVNDTLGLDAGDLLLQQAADRLRQGMRPADQVARNDAVDCEIGLARLGGDEFTLCAPQLLHEGTALKVAQRVLHLMRRPFTLEGREITLTTSIGIALFPDDCDDAATLLKYADTAMYHAKSHGRDNCQFYNPDLTREAMRRLDLESNLRLALERDEFYLAYQPQLDLASQRIRSLEALIRWQHPTLGLISPQEFISVAEENGLIIPIGDWVLRTVCSDLACWHASGYPFARSGQPLCRTVQHTRSAWSYQNHPGGDGCRTAMA